MLKNQIFIVGSSYDEGNTVMMCEAYDPEKNTWISLPVPNIFRQYFRLVAYHEQEFLIPANRWSNRPKEIEVYVPNQNTWISHPDLPFLYLNPKGVVVDDKIIVHENNKENRRRYQKVDPPVYWDDSAQIWRFIDKSSPWFHIERYFVLVLDDYRVLKGIIAKNKCPVNKWERIFPI
ncbi:hypothetical protein AVEN_73522-1 [Araneus ventricosus]|uniref:Uncharacterized protein n=1 Tax=Araneus ventricosus TaxID=182803 RepID=A0A4Y2M0F7_ARAVE|nr:hypothetical protein AVEN_73522-1 [Araneus ventricosus]